jgi:hypothetical protein
MSAAAEIYLTIEADKSTSPNRYSEVVDEWLSDVGFFTSGENYRRSSYQSGDIYEVRGYSVSYDVFDPAWAESLVKKLYKLDPKLDVEVFVYNLDRTADVVARTKREVAV